MEFFLVSLSWLICLLKLIPELVFQCFVPLKKGARLFSFQFLTRMWKFFFFPDKRISKRAAFDSCSFSTKLWRNGCNRIEIVANIEKLLQQQSWNSKLWYGNRLPLKINCIINPECRFCRLNNLAQIALITSN